MSHGENSATHSQQTHNRSRSVLVPPKADITFDAPTGRERKGSLTGQTHGITKQMATSRRLAELPMRGGTAPSAGATGITTSTASPKSTDNLAPPTIDASPPRRKSVSNAVDPPISPDQVSGSIDDLSGLSAANVDIDDIVLSDDIIDAFTQYNGSGGYLSGGVGMGGVGGVGVDPHRQHQQVLNHVAKVRVVEEMQRIRQRSYVTEQERQRLMQQALGMDAPKLARRLMEADNQRAKQVSDHLREWEQRRAAEAVLAAAEQEEGEGEEEGRTRTSERGRTGRNHRGVVEGGEEEKQNEEGDRDGDRDGKSAIQGSPAAPPSPSPSPLMYSASPTKRAGNHHHSGVIGNSSSVSFLTGGDLVVSEYEPSPPGPAVYPYPPYASRPGQRSPGAASATAAGAGVAEYDVTGTQEDSVVFDSLGVRNTASAGVAMLAVDSDPFSTANTSTNNNINSNSDPNSATSYAGDNEQTVRTNDVQLRRPMRREERQDDPDAQFCKAFDEVERIRQRIIQRASLPLSTFQDFDRAPPAAATTAAVSGAGGGAGGGGGSGEAAAAAAIGGLGGGGGRKQLQTQLSTSSTTSSTTSSDAFPSPTLPASAPVSAAVPAATATGASSAATVLDRTVTNNANMEDQEDLNVSLRRRKDSKKLTVDVPLDSDAAAVTAAAAGPESPYPLLSPTSTGIHSTLSPRKKLLLQRQRRNSFQQQQQHPHGFDFTEVGVCTLDATGKSTSTASTSSGANNNSSSRRNSIGLEVAGSGSGEVYHITSSGIASTIAGAVAATAASGSEVAHTSNAAVPQPGAAPLTAVSAAAVAITAALAPALASTSASTSASASTQLQATRPVKSIRQISSSSIDSAPPAVGIGMGSTGGGSGAATGIGMDALEGVGNSVSVSGSGSGSGSGGNVNISSHVPLHPTTTATGAAAVFASASASGSGSTAAVLSVPFTLHPPGPVSRQVSNASAASTGSGGTNDTPGSTTGSGTGTGTGIGAGTKGRKMSRVSSRGSFGEGLNHLAAGSGMTRQSSSASIEDKNNRKGGKKSSKPSNLTAGTTTTTTTPKSNGKAGAANTNPATPVVPNYLNGDGDADVNDRHWGQVANSIDSLIGSRYNSFNTGRGSRGGGGGGGAFAGDSHPNILGSSLILLQKQLEDAEGAGNLLLDNSCGGSEQNEECDVKNSDSDDFFSSENIRRVDSETLYDDEGVTSSKLAMAQERSTKSTAGATGGPSVRSSRNDNPSRMSFDAPVDKFAPLKANGNTAASAASSSADVTAAATAVGAAAPSTPQGRGSQHPGFSFGFGPSQGGGGKASSGAVSAGTATALANLNQANAVGRPSSSSSRGDGGGGSGGGGRPSAGALAAFDGPSGGTPSGGGGAGGGIRRNSRSMGSEEDFFHYNTPPPSSSNVGEGLTELSDISPPEVHMLAGLHKPAYHSGSGSVNALEGLPSDDSHSSMGSSMFAFRTSK
jgi:hypothetical protein